MGAAFSPNQAKVLLQRNALNTAKKVESGKPLTPKELAMLEQIAEGGDATSIKAFANNQVELAEILSVNRKTIQRWLKNDGSPGTRPDGRYEVAAWREFKRQHGKGGDEFDDDIDVARAKAEQIILQNERLKFRIKQDRGEVLPKIVAKEVFGKLLTSAKARTYSSIIRIVTLSRLAPNTALAAEEVKKEIDSIWQSLTDSQWLK